MLDLQGRCRCRTLAPPPCRSLQAAATPGSTTLATTPGTTLAPPSGHHQSLATSLGLPPYSRTFAAAATSPWLQATKKHLDNQEFVQLMEEKKAACEGQFEEEEQVSRVEMSVEGAVGRVCPEPLWVGRGGAGAAEAAWSWGLSHAARAHRGCGACRGALN